LMYSLRAELRKISPKGSIVNISSVCLLVVNVSCYIGHSKPFIKLMAFLLWSRVFFSHMNFHTRLL